MPEFLIVLLAIIGFAIVFPLFWMGIVLLLSKLGGWSELAARFGSDAPPQGELFTWCSARLRMVVSYSNCLRITVSRQGVHMRTLVFFKMGHQPLFIPWTAVQDVRVTRVWWHSSAKLIIRDDRDGWSASIVLYGWGLADRLLERFKEARGA